MTDWPDKRHELTALDTLTKRYIDHMFSDFVVDREVTSEMPEVELTAGVDFSAFIERLEKR